VAGGEDGRSSRPTGLGDVPAAGGGSLEIFFNLRLENGWKQESEAVVCFW
jgi:hypothetical protein